MKGMIKLMKKYKLKIFAVIAGLITLTSCAYKKMDDTQEGKRIAEKSTQLITSDVDKNDTVHIGEKQYLVSGVSLSSGNSAYGKTLSFSDGTTISLYTNKKENLNEYLIDMTASKECNITLNFSRNEFFYTWDYNNDIKVDEYKKDNMYFSNIKYTNITANEAKKILTEFYNGKSVADICKKFSKNIKI